MDINSEGIGRFVPPNTTDTDWANPKNNAANITPWGVHLPNITVTKAMKPWPATNAGKNEDTREIDIVAPPNPAINPENKTAIYLTKNTFIFKVSAAFGCSPTAINLIPHFVLYINI